MTQESLTELVSLAQAGDPEALENVLIWAYTPITFLCRKILKEEAAAQEQTRELLYMLSRKLDTLQDPAQFQNWIARLAIAKCLQVLPEIRRTEAPNQPAAEILPIAGETLNQAQTVDAVQRMVDMLPEEPRICITLLCCSDLHSSDIAQATNYTLETVHNHMAQAQQFVMEQIEIHQNLGTILYPITSLKEVLLAAMYQPADAQEATAAVYRAIGKELPPLEEPVYDTDAPIATEVSQHTKILLWVLFGILIALILVLGGLNIMVKRSNTYSVDDYVPTQTLLPAETTEAAAEEASSETEAAAAETEAAPAETEEVTAETTAEIAAETTESKA